jgi:hypothetical protein
MKQYLLFAGTEAAKALGVKGFIGDFDSAAEAFLSLVDNQNPSEWWHILDIQTGEVLERRHIRVSNGMMGFQRSEWIVGNAGTKAAAPVAAGADLAELEAGLRSLVTTGVKNGSARAKGVTHEAVEH